VKEHLLDNIRAVYANSMSSIRTSAWFTESFDARHGVRRGCVVSPLFYCLYGQGNKWGTLISRGLEWNAISRWSEPYKHNNTDKEYNLFMERWNQYLCSYALYMHIQIIVKIGW